MKPGKYTLIHLGITGLVMTAAWFLIQDDPGPKAAKFSLIAAGLTSLTSLLAYIVVYTSLDKNPKMFMSYLFGGIFIKMMTGLTAILLVTWKAKEMAIPFAITFLLSYLVFTSMEVIFLLKKSRETA